MILLTYGTRPEFLKLTSLISELDREDHDLYKLLFTGQHKDLANFPYDFHVEMKDELNRLDSIIASIMNELPKYIEEYNIRSVVVQGDTTSALAIALSAFNNGIKVIHLEAGLRTYDNENPFPEEMNRQIISRIADIHFCPTDRNAYNLHNENIYKNVYVVGNTVIDNLLSYKSECEYTNTVLVTMHRRENHAKMHQWFTEINKLAKHYDTIRFVMPIHPNPNVQKHKHLLTNVNVIDPLPYDEMLKLLCKVKLVITDSGGLQEECSFLNKKCLVCRTVTERTESVGRSSFMVNNPEQLETVFKKHIRYFRIDEVCPFGDGYASEQIVAILKKYL